MQYILKKCILQGSERRIYLVAHSYILTLLFRGTNRGAFTKRFIEKLAQM